MTNRLEQGKCLHCATPMVRTDGFPLCSRCEFKARQAWHKMRSGEPISPHEAKKFKFGPEKLTVGQMKKEVGVR